MKLKTTLPTHTPSALQDVVLLLSRIGLGVVLIAHGLKSHDEGIEGTAAGFDAMGIPFPGLAAHDDVVELVGGTMLVAGLSTPLIGLLAAADMAGAFWHADRDGGVFVAEGGWELVAMIGLCRAHTRRRGRSSALARPLDLRSPGAGQRGRSTA